MGVMTYPVPEPQRTDYPASMYGEQQYQRAKTYWIGYIVGWTAGRLQGESDCLDKFRGYLNSNREKVRCIYCDRLVHNLSPSRMKEQEWVSARAEHAITCRWALSLGHPHGLEDEPAPSTRSTS